MNCMEHKDALVGFNTFVQLMTAQTKPLKEIRALKTHPFPRSFGYFIENLEQLSKHIENRKMIIKKSIE